MFPSVSDRMFSMSSSHPDRLAQAVVSRRLALGMHSRTALDESTPFSYRVLSDMETGRRENYSANTLLQLDAVLRWRPGSAARVLSGGVPEAVEDVDPDHEGSGAGDTDDQVPVSKVWLAKLLVMANDLDRHRQFAARDILGFEEVPAQDGFSSDLDTLLMRTRSLIDQVEAGVIDSLGSMRSAALVLHRAGIGSMADLYAHDDHEGPLSSDARADGHARAGGAAAVPPAWKGKALEEMSDDELREAAGMDEVWADYVRTKRPELADWDY